MTFVQPSLLLLLTLVAIPIVLHLLTLFRVRTVELSTYRFLFDQYVPQRRRLKFVEALLAVLRTLFLLLLLLVFARPAVSHFPALFGGGTGRDVVMLIDCSAGMNAKTDGVTALQRVKNAALAVSRDLGQDDKLTLVRVTHHAETIITQYAPDLDTIEKNIESLEVSATTSNLVAALGTLFDPRHPDRSHATVYVFTDAQADAWPAHQREQLANILPAEAQLIVVDVGSGSAVSNCAVVGAPPRSSRAVVNLPVALDAVVTNHGLTPATLPIALIINDKEVTHAALTVDAGETVTHRMTHEPTEPGVMRGRFEIPADDFPDDDTYLFTLYVQPQVRVLMVNGAPTADPLRNEVLYLAEAIRSITDAEDLALAGLLIDAPPTGGIAAREIVEAQLDAQQLRDASVVVLANCGALDEDHAQALRDFVWRGGGLMIFPGDRVRPETYNDQLFGVAGRVDEHLIAAQLLPAEGDPNDADTFEHLTAIDFSHTALSVFDDAEDRYLRPANVYRRFGIEPIGPPGRVRALARFGSKRPALVEGRFGDGVVILAAFPINSVWSDLPLRSEFVPLALRLIQHADHRATIESPSVVPANGVAELRVATDWAPVRAHVTDTTGRNTPLEFQWSGTRLAAVFDATDRKGYYTVQFTGGRAQPPRAGTAGFAVNLAQAESSFHPMTADDLRTWLPMHNVAFVDASAEAQQVIGSISPRDEIWRPLLAIVFVVIGLEFLLATLSGRRRGSNHASTPDQRSRPSDRPSSPGGLSPA